MRRALLALLMLLGGLIAARADVSRATLDAIAAAPQPDARLPLDIPFTDANGAPRTLREALGGRPAVLVFADYTCRTLCGPILAFAAAGLDKSGLEPGRDFHLVVVGIDPKDRLADAGRFKGRHLGKDTPLAGATVMLSGTSDAVSAVTGAAGYRFTYDRAHDQFAHPAAAYVVTGDGRVARVLSGLGLSGPDLRLALVDAGNGRIGNLADQIHLLCYGFDPARGLYTASITRLLNIGGVITVLAILSGIAGLTLARRRGRAA
jgi:protein SCO1/2